MTVPKQRHTSSRRDQRRMHLFIKSPGLVKCPKCSSLIMSHRVCPNCGFYGDKEVVNVFAKLTKKEKKEKEKEIKAEKEKK